MNYKGKKPRGGMSAGQVAIAAILVLLAMLAITIHMNTELTGQSAGDQIYTALFVAKDWE